MKQIRALWICITLIINIQFCEAQISSFETGRHFEASGNQQAALRAYLHSYFSNEDNEAPRHAARIFKALGDHENAIRYLTIQYFLYPHNSPQRNAVRYEKTQVYLEEGEYNRAKIELFQINKKTPNFDEDQYYFYRGLTHCFNREFETGFRDLKRLTYYPFADTVALDRLQKKLEKNHKKGYRLHQILSGIFPGAGQYLAGDIKSGLNSTLLNGGLVVLFFEIGAALTYPDAALAVGPWLMRYHIGGIINARKSAEAQKDRRFDRYMSEVVVFLRSAQVQGKSR